jgi:hypothetical protein
MLRIVIISVAVLMLTGCVFTKEKFKPVRYFDIGNPEIAKSPICLKVGSFTVTGPYKQEMVYRTEKNELLKDQYNKWALTPDILLRRYLIIAYPGDSSKELEITITGNILSFEADILKKEVLFTVEYRITASSNIATIEKISAFKAKFDDSSPEAFAQAMSHAVSDFTESLSLDLKKISNK